MTCKGTCGWALIALLMCGCQMKHRMMVPVVSTDLLPEERAAMQTRILPASEEVVFAATVAVLQDLGWKLDTVDRSSGLIRASTEKRLEPLGPKEEKISSFEWRRAAIQKRSSEKDQWTRWDEMVAHIEKWPAKQSRERIVLARCGALPAMSYPARVDKRDVVINAPAKEESQEIHLGEVYDTLFRRIDQAILDRTRTGEE
ncbi:MAG TPA: hypothetical protein DCM68_04970 [Verrucomicrobia bacterium]|nr:hypothetical protein [Verrucomicrobiota bacterium]